MIHWTLRYDGFDPAQEGLREALTTLGNGYFCTRGAASWAKANDVHYPGTYRAGLYNRLDSEVAGRLIENEDLVNLPNWLPICVEIGEPIEDAIELDLRRGILTRTTRFKDDQGRTTRLSERRLVHMKHYHLAAQEWQLTAENWSGPVTIRAGLDGNIINAGVARYRALNSCHLEPAEVGVVDGETIYLKTRTNQSNVAIAQAARLRTDAPYEVVDGEFVVSQEIAAGESIRLEKVVALYTSGDHAATAPKLEVIQAVRRANNFESLATTHALVWEMLWNRFDIKIETEEADDPMHPQLILRLHLFHLLQTVSHHTIDLDAGVPARGWHGEAYRGHIFWDELFILPFFNFQLPQITAALLRYRYRRLDRARDLAAESGFSGAMFPWQSGSNGREESQHLHLNPHSGRWIVDRSRLQRHVNGAIAHNVWHYWEVTGDLDFMIAHGGELMIEIARFWASLATYNQQLERYEILGVMGPDEYHDGYPGADEGGLNNNTYTNLLAVWCIWRTLDFLEELSKDHREAFCTALALSDGELEKWREVSKKMVIPFHGDGLLSQFEGYEELKELDWAAYRAKYGDIHRLDRILEGEGDSCNNYQASKQADVLMLFYLFSANELEALFQRLGYPFTRETIQKNIDYYRVRTAHGSTLSGLVHGWVRARADRAESWNLFLAALNSDVADVQGGTTAEGIHLGAMAGTVDLLQRCYAGLSASDDVLWFNPCLPDALRRISFTAHYRGHTLEIDLNQSRLQVRARHSSALPVTIGFRDKITQIGQGETREFAL